MPDINFLRNRRKKLTNLQKRDKKWMYWSIYFFSGVMVIFFIVLMVHLFFNRRLATIVATQENTTEQILNNESVEKDFVLMMSKLDVLGQIYRQRRDKQEAINYFSTVFGSDVTIKQIEYAGGDNLLTFILSADNVFSIDRVLEFLKSSEIQDKFVQVTPSDLRRNESASYQISIAVVLRDSE